MQLNWQDLSLILAVARAGSVRGAAPALGMHHSSIVRRLAGFERKTGIKVFVRKQTGYELTEAGKDIVATARQIESETLSLERRLGGQDERLEGKVSLTLPLQIAQDLLMDALLGFAEAYPAIELDLRASSEEINLANRRTDVAVRVSPHDPPERLVGRSPGRCAMAVYETTGGEGSSRIRRLVWADQLKFDQFTLPGFDIGPQFNILFNDLSLQLEACKRGYGRMVLPCFLGDAQPDIRRSPGFEKVPGPKIWILTHTEYSGVPRVAALTEALWQALKAKQAILRGESGHL